MKKSDAYREGRLSDDMRTQVENHLKGCDVCAESYKLEAFAESIINQEKELKPDDFLTTRIMAKIERLEEQEYESVSVFNRILRPAILIGSMAASILAGVLIGNIYKPSVNSMSMPVELALIDDITIESITNLSNE